MSEELKATRILQGRLTVSELMAREPLTVRRGTRIPEVAKVLAQSHCRHVLVTDHQGRLVGVVSDRDLLRHMAANETGATGTFEDTPVESIMMTKFISGSPDAHPEDLTALMVDGAFECLPILEEGKLVGVMTPADLLLSWSRLHKLVEQAATDPVTGLANRATFDRRLIEEMERARRQHTPLGLMLFDVDHFKTINDTCGHAAGDAVLRLIGGCLQRNLRKYDAVARYGGDEFAGLCYGCGHTQIETLNLRIQSELRTLSVPFVNERRAITLSVGTAVLQPACREITPEQFLRTADECLYRAKASGRDCACGVEIADGSRRFGPTFQSVFDPVAPAANTCMASH